MGMKADLASCQGLTTTLKRMCLDCLATKEVMRANQEEVARIMGRRGKEGRKMEARINLPSLRTHHLAVRVMER